MNYVKVLQLPSLLGTIGLNSCFNSIAVHSTALCAAHKCSIVSPCAPFRSFLHWWTRWETTVALSCAMYCVILSQSSSQGLCTSCAIVFTDTNAKGAPKEYINLFRYQYLSLFVAHTTGELAVLRNFVTQRYRYCCNILMVLINFILRRVFMYMIVFAILNVFNMDIWRCSGMMYRPVVGRWLSPLAFTSTSISAAATPTAYLSMRTWVA